MVTLLIRKFPFDKIRNLLLLLRLKEPLNSQRMVGLGSPFGLHVSSTLVWISAFVLGCGTLLPGPNPAGISDGIERKETVDLLKP